MDNLQKFTNQVRTRITLLLLVGTLLVAATGWLTGQVLRLDTEVVLSLMIAAAVVVSLGSALLLTNYLVTPMKKVWQAVLHIAPDAANVPAPRLDPHALGGELIANLVSHIYQLASVVADVEKSAAAHRSDLANNFVANALPLPMMILDKNRSVLFANKAMLDYLGRSAAETTGQELYSVVDLAFGSENTFDTWYTKVKASEPVASSAWERVRLTLPADNTVRLFDLAAYYNRNNPEGYETMLVFFDHTTRYSQDDQALSFVALAVHELRTPITLLRGYIEALEEDLDGKLEPELVDFLHKMKASARSLTDFINNMLNVARVENDQLVLQLHEETWADIVQTAVQDAGLRATVQGVALQTDIAPDLPSVGVDRVGMYEVLLNLIDNAVKYSGNSKQVIVKAALNRDGMVETTVQDFGVGIATGVMPNLFEKFYRSHRSRAQVGGTGLGLYLCKSIVEAHGGSIWVRSKEGQGSTFGFSIFPYAKLADAKKTGDNKGITRGAHGWIKNHSLYSR